MRNTQPERCEAAIIQMRNTQPERCEAAIIRMRKPQPSKSFSGSSDPKDLERNKWREYWMRWNTSHRPKTLSEGREFTKWNGETPYLGIRSEAEEIGIQINHIRSHSVQS